VAKFNQQSTGLHIGYRDPASGDVNFRINTDGTINFQSCTFGDGTVQTTAATAGGTPGGSNTQIQFNNSGAFGGSGATLDATGNLTLPTGTVAKWSTDIGLSRGSAGLLYVGNGTAGDNTGQLWAGATQFGIDGISTPGAFQLYPGSNLQPFNTILNVVQHVTAVPGTNVGQAPIVSQGITDPSGTSNTNYFASAAFYNVVPAANAQNIGTLSGIFIETKHNGSGTIGGGGVSNNGLIGIDAEVFLEGSGGVGNAGMMAGYFRCLPQGSGNVNNQEGITVVSANGGSGTTTNNYGIQIQSPGGLNTGPVTNNSGLYIGDQSTVGSTLHYALFIAGGDVELGSGTVHSTGTFQLSFGTASAPVYSFNSNANTGMFHSASNTIGWSANATLGMELDFSWGLYLHDGNAIGFSSNTTSLSKDTSLARTAAATIAVGAGANTNDSSGTILANAHAVARTATQALTAGQPVKVDTGTAGNVLVTTTTDTAAGIPVGFVINSPGAGGTAFVATSGVVTCTLGTGTASIGQFVIVDTTTNGRVKCTSSYTAGTVLGVALTAQGSVGSTFSVLIGLR